MGGSTLFNGTSSVISCGILPSITASQQEITISFWAKLNSANATVDAIMLANAGNNCTNGFCVRKYTDKKIIVYHGGTSVTFTPKYNTWNFYTIVIKRATSIEVFENGVLKGSKYTSVSDYSFVDGSTPFRIGATGTQWFRGQIGEVSIVPRVVTAAERDTIMNGSFPSDATNLWKLDDLPSTYIDTIGGATGTGTNTVYSPDVPVQLRQSRDEEAMSSLSFDGVDDKMETAYSSVLTFGLNSFSITFEYKMTGLVASNRDIIVKNRNTGETLFLIRSRSNGTELLFQFYTDASNKIELVVSNFWMLNKWGKYTFIVDRETGYAEAYRSGLLLGRYAIVGNPVDTTTKGFIIGQGAYSGGYSKGLAKKFRVYSRVISLSEIRDLHLNNIVPTTGLVLDLPMNEGAGAIAYDQSGNGNHGTISGATWSSDVPSKARKLYGGNLVENGDFSYVPPGSTVTRGNGVFVNNTAGGDSYFDKFGFVIDTGFSAGGGALIDKTVLYNGKPTFKYFIGGAGEYVDSGTIPRRLSTVAGFEQYAMKVQPNTSYSYSFAVKTEYISGDSAHGASFAIVEYSGAASVLGDAFRTTQTKVSSDFTVYTGIFTTRATTRYLVFNQRIYGHTGAGTLAMAVWIGDIQLTETTPPVRTLHP